MNDVTKLEAELEGWKAAIGRRQVARQRLEVESLKRYALALGLDATTDAVPLAHWAFFLPMAETSRLGPDGHPARGGFLPAISLPRRMFAAAHMRFEAPLALGEEAEMTSLVKDVRLKTGRSGALAFVEVERSLMQQGMLRVRETQTYVYRQAGAPQPLPQPAAQPATASETAIEWTPGPVELFRFSAATFNSHRIHYDLPYAREAEGYPALVVQGPFVATQLAGLAARTMQLREFGFQAQAPLFCGQPVQLIRTGETLCARRCDGVDAMTACAR